MAAAHMAEMNRQTVQLRAITEHVESVKAAISANNRADATESLKVLRSIRDRELDNKGTGTGYNATVVDTARHHIMELEKAIRIAFKK
ncbi:MAG TPA: hypothetical protein VJH23_05905 [archaeon]|nr:hypothetical protein [archaeon]